MTMKGAKTDVEWFSPRSWRPRARNICRSRRRSSRRPRYCLIQIPTISASNLLDYVNNYLSWLQVKLRYAIALAKSRKRDDKYRAIGLLEGNGHSSLEGLKSS